MTPSTTASPETATRDRYAAAAHATEAALCCPVDYDPRHLEIIPAEVIENTYGHAMERGKRYAVCDKTFQLYGKPPYREHFAIIEPLTAIPPGEAQPFDCSGMPSDTRRKPRATTTTPPPKPRIAAREGRAEVVARAFQKWCGRSFECSRIWKNSGFSRSDYPHPARTLPSSATPLPKPL